MLDSRVIRINRSIHNIVLYLTTHTVHDPVLISYR